MGMRAAYSHEETRATSMAQLHMRVMTFHHCCRPLIHVVPGSLSDYVTNACVAHAGKWCGGRNGGGGGGGVRISIRAADERSRTSIISDSVEDVRQEQLADSRFRGLHA